MVTPRLPVIDTVASAFSFVAAVGGGIHVGGALGVDTCTAPPTKGFDKPFNSSMKRFLNP
jgi:hypothetical protein